MNTLEHARLLLGAIDPDTRLVDNYLAFVKSPSRNPTNNNDFYAWLLARTKDLCGANTFEDAFLNPDFRTLLAFGYMGYTRHPDLPVPRVTQSMPTPKVSADLEPDYFPVLLKQIRLNAASSVSFAEAIKESEQHIVNLVAQLPVDSPLASPATSNSRKFPWVVAIIFVICSAIALQEKHDNPKK